MRFVTSLVGLRSRCLHAGQGVCVTSPGFRPVAGEAGILKPALQVDCGKFMDVMVDFTSA